MLSEKLNVPHTPTFTSREPTVRDKHESFLPFLRIHEFPRNENIWEQYHPCRWNTLHFISLLGEKGGNKSRGRIRRNFDYVLKLVYELYKYLPTESFGKNAFPNNCLTLYPKEFQMRQKNESLKFQGRAINHFDWIINYYFWFDKLVMINIHAFMTFPEPFTEWTN